MQDTCIVIPARLKSTRFPRKPLVKILGKSMIIRVAEIANKIISKKHIYIATDSIEIESLVVKSGFNCIQTNSRAITGTDRVAIASKRLNYKFIINIQGDEPLIDPKDIEKCISLKKRYPNYVINGYCFIGENEKPSSVNIPKLVTNTDNDLIYISRSLIPGMKEKSIVNSIKYKKQVCIYAFTKNQLEEFHNLGRKSTLEEIEDIEIIRFLDLNIKVKMYQCNSGSLAVDIPSDVYNVEKELLKREQDR